MGKLSASAIIGFFVWVGCAIDFLILSAILTQGFKAQNIPSVISQNKENPLLFILLIFLIIGGFGLIVFILEGIVFIIHREVERKRNFLFSAVFILFGIMTLPFQIFFAVLNPPSKNRNYFFKIVFAILVLLFFLPAWIGIGFTLSYFPGQRLGFIPFSVKVAGGSMYPTFPKPQSNDPKIGESQVVAEAQMYSYPGGITVFGKNLFGRRVGEGDLVVFENSKTRKITKEETGLASGFIKRAIGIAGDTIELRDGLVYLNGKIIKEPYIARARSTFGGNFLKDCQKLKVPKGKIFVMGDNRKGSDDSRFDVGFVDLSDVEYILGLKDQKGSLTANWHNPANDDKESERITLNPIKYLELVNNLRIKNGLKPLRYQPKLALSSKLRAQNILKYDDFSFNATKSGYTMSKAMADAGYSNIVYGELPTNGAYEAEELYDYYVAFPNTKDFLLNKDYQEIGIADVNGNLNNCPTTLVVVQMAGYVAPNYSKEQVKSWEDLLDNLKSIQGGWENLKNYPPIYDNYRNDVDRINQIIQTRIENLSGIVDKMKANQWLTKNQNDYLKLDESLSQEQNKLASKLNSL